MLEERSAAMQKAVMAAVNSTDTGLEDKIANVTGEANAMIEKILADETLTAEQQEAMIAKIDKATEASLQDLAAEQLQLDSSLGTFVGGEQEASKVLQEQLAGLEGVLKGSQMEWLRQVVEDKKVLQSQIEQLGSRVEQISQAVEAGASEATGEIGELQQERLDAVRRLKEQMAKMADQRHDMSTAAQQVAKFAQAEASGTATDAELEALRPRVQDLYDRVEKSRADLWKQLDELNSGTKKEETQAFINELLGKTEDVGTLLSTDAVAAWKHQQALGEQLDIASAMVKELSRLNPSALAEVHAVTAGLQDLRNRASRLRDDMQPRLARTAQEDRAEEDTLRALLAQGLAAPDPEVAISALERRLDEDAAVHAAPTADGRRRGREA